MKQATGPKSRPRLATGIVRLLGLVVCAALVLQLFFVARIACMLLVDPQSTTFQRSQAFAIATDRGRLPWRQEWVPYGRISDQLKRAVIASEDGSFAQHDGVDWDAMEKAWQRNAKAQEQASSRSTPRSAKIVGGSTITQQLAKNLFLSGERTLLRKGEELVITFTLEALLGKRRILEIYLNSVEWGSGVFGAEAAARHYFSKPASALSAGEAARLAVMLPRPRYFEKLPNSAYLSGRAAVIVARMGDVELP